MNLFGIWAQRRSASVARERLQILLTHERHIGSQADLIPALREDILKTVTKHIAVDPDKVQVTLDRGDVVSILEINVEVPTSQAKRKSTKRRRRNGSHQRRAAPPL